MRLVFAGTPVFAATALAALHQAGHDIALVLTQPDRPAGRGMQTQASAVKQCAVANGWPVIQPMSLRLDGSHSQDAQAAQQAIAQSGASLMVVVAYGLLLPAWALQSVALGCVNVHASLLPRWRGAAPIQRAIEAGDTETGVCLMQMDAGLDTGDVLCHQSLPIHPNDTSTRLHDRLAPLGAQLLVDQLSKTPPWPATPQATVGVTYAEKIRKHEALIQWHDSAVLLSQRIRAFDPFPGMHTQHQGQTLKIWSAQAQPDASHHATPGQVLQVTTTGLDIACGQGVLRITEVQRPGGKRVPVSEWLKSQTLTPDTVFGGAHD